MSEEHARAAKINDAVKKVEDILNAVDPGVDWVICVRSNTGPKTGAGGMASNIGFEDSMDLIMDVAENAMKAFEQQQQSDA